MFRWFTQVSHTERRTFWACFGGWSLDAMDAQMFSLVIPTLLASWHISKADAGWLTAVTLVAGALGGWVAGYASDRFGRVRVLQATILWYSLFTLAIGFAQDFTQLIAARVLQGIGFGGEWAAGAVLMAETIRSEHRGKAMGWVQSGWAVGWGAAVLLYTALFHLMPEAEAWRVLFMLGILPALLVIVIRRNVAEPEISARTRLAAARGERPSMAAIFRPELLWRTAFGALLGLGSHGGYYALMTFLPTFLKTERHLSVLNTGGYLAVIIIGSFFGYITSGWLSDRIGRRRNVLFFAVCCVASLCLYLLLPLSNAWMLWLGLPLGFFASGIPAGLGAFFAELFPTAVRGAAQGFCYNAGRILSSAFPVLVGTLAATIPLGQAIAIFAALAYGLAILAASLLPETRGTHLTAELGESVTTPAPETVT
jgi:MFS family permease